MSESATVSFARPITAAAGVYAPGHLGELTQYLPFELVDDVLPQTRTVQRRLRDAAVSGRGVLRARPGAVPPPWLCPGVAEAHRRADRAGCGAESSEKALRDLRRRLGPAPFKALFEVVAGPLAQPRTPGVCFRRHAHRRLRRLQLAQGARHRTQPLLAGPHPLPDGLRRLPDPAADVPGRDRHPRPARRHHRRRRRPGRGHPGPAAAAAAAPGHAGAARPRLRRRRLPDRAQPAPARGSWCAASRPAGHRC